MVQPQPGPALFSVPEGAGHLLAPRSPRAPMPHYRTFPRPRPQLPPPPPDVRACCPPARPHRRKLELQAQAQAALEADNSWWKDTAGAPPNLVSASTKTEFKALIMQAAPNQLVVSPRSPAAPCLAGGRPCHCTPPPRPAVLSVRGLGGAQGGGGRR